MSNASKIACPLVYRRRDDSGKSASRRNRKLLAHAHVYYTLAYGGLHTRLRTVVTMVQGYTCGTTYCTYLQTKFERPTAWVTPSNIAVLTCL